MVLRYVALTCSSENSLNKCRVCDDDRRLRDLELVSEFICRVSWIGASYKAQSR